MKIYSFQNEMTFTNLKSIEFYSIKYIFWFFMSEETKNNIKITLNDKIIGNNLKVQFKKLKIIKEFFFKKLNFFYIDFYHFLLNYRTIIESEKFWLNFVQTQNSIIKIYIENYKFLKTKESLIFFKFKPLVWRLIETYLTKVSKFLFYSQKYYLNFNYSFLFKKKFFSYSSQIYSFLLSNHVINNKFFLKLKKNFKNQNNWFIYRQICHKLLLQFVLIVRQESILSLTSYFSTLNRTIYDSIEYLYSILKNKTMFNFRIDLLNNFGLPIRNGICLKLVKSIFNEKSNFLDLALNDNTICDLFLSKIQIFNHVFKNQIFYLVQSQLCRKFEKYNVNNYYRTYCNQLNCYSIPYNNNNSLIQFKNSFLQVCTNEKIIIEHSKIFSKWFLKFRFIEFFKTPISNSYFSLFGQKVGLFFYGFYLIQQKKMFLRIKNFQGEKKSQIYLKTHILPSKFYLKEYLNQLKHIIKNSTIYSQEVLIKKLETKINTWSQYYQISTNKQIFNFCDFKIFNWLWKWSCRRHPNKSRNWIKKKYFISTINLENKKKWSFCLNNKSTKFILCLPEHKDIVLVRHIRTRQYLSSYDKNWKYWLKRFASNSLNY